MKIYFFKKRLKEIKTIYPTFLHFKLFVIFHGKETFLVGRIFFDEIKMTNGFWVSKKIKLIIQVSLMRCILINRTIGMRSFSIGTNPTIGTNGHNSYHH